MIKMFKKITFTAMRTAQADTMKWLVVKHWNDRKCDTIVHVVIVIKSFRFLVTTPLPPTKTLTMAFY